MEGKDMRDKEFDVFFQKAAENLEVPYHPKAWDKMQQKLSKSAGTRGTNYRRGFWGLGALLLLTLLWWSGDRWLIENRVVKPIVDLKSIHMSIADQYLPDLPIAEVSEVIKTSTDQDVTAKPKVHGAVANRSDSFGQFNDKEKGAVAIISLPGTVNIPAYLTPAGIAFVQWGSLVPGRSSLKVAVPQKEVAIIEDVAPFHRWGINAGVSPDLSGVGFRHIDDISGKVSVQLEYFIRPELSLSSGVIFTNMIYQAAPEDYKREMSYKPNWINAQCQVLEVPLNLRWYALGNERQRFFLSGGMSSYLMLTEDYEYIYNSEEYGTYTREWGVENENQHFFKVASFSVGYERRLGRQWAVQVEPFVRLPLAGVGAGEVKLSTLGMMLSVHYRWRKK